MPTRTPSSSGCRPTPSRSSRCRPSRIRSTRCKLEPSRHRGAVDGDVAPVAAAARERRLRGEAGAVQPADDVQLEAKGAADIAEDAGAELAPDRRDDEPVRERAIDAQVRRERVRLIDDAERQQQQSQRARRTRATATAGRPPAAPRTCRRSPDQRPPGNAATAPARASAWA